MVLNADGSQLLVPADCATRHGELVAVRIGHTCLAVLTPEQGHGGHAWPQAQEGHAGHAGHEGGAAQYLWELRRWYYRNTAALPTKKLWQRIRTSQKVCHSFVVPVLVLTQGQGVHGRCCTRCVHAGHSHMSTRWQFATNPGHPPLMPRHGSRCTTGCSPMRGLGS